MHKFLLALGLGFGALNTALWFGAPAIKDCVDAAAGRLNFPGRPTIITGLQELLVYYDPWLAKSVIPLAFTLGFVVIPFLNIPQNVVSENSSRVNAYAIVGSILLVFLESIWLFLNWVQAYCRGPNWNFYWPSETWDEWKVVPLNQVYLSEYVWERFFGGMPGETWLIRESFGLLILCAYFLSGWLVVAFVSRSKQEFARYWIATVVFQIAMAVPIKMALVHFFNIKYIVAIVELWINV